jgi:hypothetical protein
LNGGLNPSASELWSFENNLNSCLNLLIDKTSNASQKKRIEKKTSLEPKLKQFKQNRTLVTLEERICSVHYYK